MSYIFEIFERLNLQQIREFLFHGVECDVSNETYRKRLEIAEEDVFKVIDENLPNKEERDKVVNEVHHYATISEEVYMEIGMQCGAILAMQLLEIPKKE